MFRSTLIDPLQISRIIPESARVTPVMLMKLIFSLKNILLKIMINTGVVIAIRDKFIASVECPAIYINVLKSVIPRNEVSRIYL